jgi:hypothetical protein
MPRLNEYNSVNKIISLDFWLSNCSFLKFPFLKERHVQPFINSKRLSIRFEFFVDKHATSDGFSIGVLIHSRNMQP